MKKAVEDLSSDMLLQIHSQHRIRKFITIKRCFSSEGE